MDLGGTWLAIPADDELRRSFADPESSADAWSPVTVPGHWRSEGAFAATDGPLFFRRGFDAAPDVGTGRRRWLTFDGIFYQGDVWMDGTYLGDTEGYFAPHTFEVTEPLAARREHTLAVEVTCSRQTDRTSKRNITGVFQHWDCFDPEWNPGGIWRPVRLTETGPVRISRLRVRCTEATEAQATLRFDATLDAVDGMPVRVRTVVDRIDDEADHALAGGDNRLEWTVTVDRPRLWWPHALGDPNLVPVRVEVLTDSPGGWRRSDERRLRTGLRSVRMKKWIVEVNGERLFVKGSNQGPTRMALGEATAAECRDDVRLAVDAGLDLLRLHAHIARPETYAAADDAGLLLWQDFPLQWGYARHIRKEAVRQAAQAVDLLGHHPSIAIWCGHNEPMGLDLSPEHFQDPKQLAQTGIKAMAQQQLPTWNKTVLDRAVKRTLQDEDGTRPVVPHSGVLPHFPKLDGTDSHLYFGWYWGDERDFPTFCRAVPRMARFVTEFGAQAVPDSDEFMDADAWPDLDRDRLARTHAAQWSLLDRYVPMADHDSYEGWRDATQEYQARVVKHHVETLRRLKYRPTGGFAHFCFADGHPAVTWSVLDHRRVPKRAYYALADACRPVIVVADRLPATVRPGDDLALDVHVVSDRRVELEGHLKATLSWNGGHREWEFGGTVPPDSVAKVATLTFTAPERPGPLHLSLQGTVGEEPVANSDESSIR